jgi:hypothetical protein
MLGFKLSIKDPCHEDWNKMDPEEKGRFCSSCNRSVTDLTRKSNEEILLAIENSSGSFCGRIQHHRTEVTLPIHRTSFLTRFALSLLLAFGGILFSVDAKAGSFLRTWKLEMKRDSINDTTTDTVMIKGTVTDEATKEPIPFVYATLLYKGNVVYKTVTDIDGNFKFIVPRNMYDKVDIEVNSLGYTKVITKEIDLSKKKNRKVEVNMKVTLCEQIMGLIVIDIFEPLPGQHDNAPSGKTINMNDYRSMPK